MEEGFKDSLKKDLEDVVVSIDDYRDKANQRFTDLDGINSNLNNLLKDILSKYFKPEDVEERTYLAQLPNDVDGRLEYIGKNSWKLKGSKAKELKNEIQKFGKDKQADEQDIRSEMEKLLQEEADAIKDNEEILEKYKDQLLKDEETEKELKAEVKEAEAKVEAIDSEISVLQTEIDEKKGLIETLDNEIQQTQTDEQEQHNIIIAQEGELRTLKDERDQENLRKTQLKEEKKQNEKELKELEKKRNDALKKNQNTAVLDGKIMDLNGEIFDLNNDISEAENNLTSIKTKIDTATSLKTTAEKERSRLLGAIKEKESLRTNYRSEHTLALEKKTDKEKEKTELRGKIALNNEKITTLDVSNRRKEYNNKLTAHKDFVKAVEENNKNITQKFRDLNINEPNKPVSTTNNPEEVKADENSAKSQGTGSGTPAQGGSSSNLPSTLTNEELTQNFINDVTKINDPEVLRKQLKGYGFQTYVNALPYIKDSKKRKQIVRMLKERQLELDDFEKGTTDSANKYTPSHDEELMEKLVGKDSRKLFEIVNKIGKNGSLKKLNKDELRTLRKAIDNYNENILNFTDDDIKALDDKFMKHVSHSALISEYDTNAWQRFWNKHGLFSRGNDRIKRADLREEILGGMKSYNTKLSERKEKSQKKGNEFQELLGRYNEVTPIEPTSKDSPSITDSRSDLQRQGDEELQSRN